MCKPLDDRVDVTVGIHNASSQTAWHDTKTRTSAFSISRFFSAPRTRCDTLRHTSRPRICIPHSSQTYSIEARRLHFALLHHNDNMTRLAARIAVKFHMHSQRGEDSPKSGSGQFHMTRLAELQKKTVRISSSNQNLQDTTTEWQSGKTCISVQFLKLHASFTNTTLASQEHTSF